MNAIGVSRQITFCTVHCQIKDRAHTDEDEPVHFLAFFRPSGKIIPQ